MMIDKVNDKDTYTSPIEIQSNPIKNSRLENELTFSRAFTKYNISNGNFVPNKSLKYVDQYGGIPVGTFNGNVLVDSSDSHSLIIGSTGSKKSRLVIMPTVKILADAGESMIISDPKAEIYERTSGYLNRQGYLVNVINLRTPSEGNSWNPLYIPYLYYLDGQLDRAYEFANDVAENLMLAERSVPDPFWDYSSRDLLFGLILLLFKFCYNQQMNCDSPNIANILRLRNYLFKNYYASGSSIINDSSSLLNKYMNEDFITLSALMGTVSAPEKTQASILCTFDEKMRCFAIQSDLLNMLTCNNVALDSLGDKKTAIFIIMPDEKTTYHKLVSLFIKQSYEYLIYNAQKHNKGRMNKRVNYILDEFSSLPTIKDFPSMISAARSRNIRFSLAIQSKHQLIEKYKAETETIQSNCSNWIFLTSREIKLLEEISLLCGKKANGTKYLVPLEALQHFNKEKGEVLVLSGRLYPYVSKLIDIKKYDNDNIIKPPRLNKVEFHDNAIDFSLYHTEISSNNTMKVKSLDDLFNNDNDDTSSKEEYDLQKELEAKFDELFGPIDAEDEV